MTESSHKIETSSFNCQKILEEIESIKGKTTEIDETLDEHFSQGVTYYDGFIGNAQIASYQGIGGQQEDWDFDYSIPSYYFNDTQIDGEQISDNMRLGVIIQKMARCISYLMNNN